MRIFFFAFSVLFYSGASSVLHLRCFQNSSSAVTLLMFADVCAGISFFFLISIRHYCRLAQVCVVAVCSLWRVFRGRKYNPLRGRVDSVRLDIRQLFIATLFFIILLFLFPTVGVYFLVFSAVNRIALVLLQTCYRTFIRTSEQ
ncbi:unnamed protein product [Enterobius vermicularis]|uniref:G_PROTEIN_RECEP_F1_2 domain-containing protein n=1 Tax=Enterobius vermicularis TaxID=51028 RepID=A0A0N4USK0_ENTVE|nr:unnamed protein product [Enterobius vermicularis]